MKRRGFTLIELLVVIAIIALLISILLPALGRARKAAQMAISMANMKQVTTATAGYQTSMQGYLPMTLTYTPRYNRTTVASNTYQGYCTWSHVGKNNAGWWQSSSAMRWADVEAEDRPLNPYVYPDLNFTTPDSTKALPATAPERTGLQMPALKDPSDKISHQRDWPNPNSEDRRQPDFSSSYNDVGTSYHWNAKWFDQPDVQTISDWAQRFRFGQLRMKLADSYNPSRFVWTHDQYPDIVVYEPPTSKYARMINGYGDVNKSVMGFMDGHAAYHEFFPNGTTDPITNKEMSFANQWYTFIFEDLKPPKVN